MLAKGAPLSDGETLYLPDQHLENFKKRSSLSLSPLDVPDSYTTSPMYGLR